MNTYRLFRLPVLFLLAAITAACAHKPGRIPIPVDMPADFSSTGQSPLPDKWWLSLRDPVLSNLIDRALADNLTLLAAWDRLDQAEAVLRRAGSSLKPDVSYDAGASHSRAETGSVTSSSQSFLFGFSASYEIDLWARVQSARDAEAFTVKATKADLLAAALSLAAEVATTWYQLAEQYGQLEMLERPMPCPRRRMDIEAAGRKSAFKATGSFGELNDDRRTTETADRRRWPRPFRKQRYAAYAAQTYHENTAARCRLYYRGNNGAMVAGNRPI